MSILLTLILIIALIVAGLVLFAANTARKVDLRAALSNSLGFGGHNVTLALSRYMASEGP